MSKSAWEKSASASNNGEFISIQTYSGYGIAIIDPEAPEHLLAPNASDDMIGEAILAALAASRMIDPNDDSYFDRDRVKESYLNWIKQMKARYGYKTKNALFKKMMSCVIDLEDGIITIRPSLHEKLEAWSGDGIREEDYVKIPADSPSAEIGAALRLAFKRCRGAKPDEYK